MKSTRQEVYAAIDTERNYQDSKWSPVEDHQHTIEEWLVYIQDYLTEAIHQASRNASPSPDALDTIRKITGMGVACMEQNGAPVRK